MTTLDVRRVGDGARMRDWIAVPTIVHADDPQFVRQLDLNERLRVHRRFSPFFAFGEAALFVAFRHGRPVGRISAQINRRHRDHRDPTSGHFGFFDCLDDRDAAIALFDRARTWLGEHGANSIAGPYALSINEESGLQVDGFDSPAAMLMNQARPWTGRLVEAAGLAPEMDTFAFRMTDVRPQERLRRLAMSAEAAGVRLRPIRVERFEEEVRLVVDIFNDAWSDNWGFVPFSEGEIRAMARELKPFYAPEYGRFVEIDGKAVAFLLAIPDINGLIRPFGGRLLPFNWLRLMWGLKRRRFRSARIPLMGLRRAHQGSPMATGILASLVGEFLAEARRHDLDWVEFSWVLENNRPMMALARMIAGEPVKRYRFYRGVIGGPPSVATETAAPRQT